MFLGCVKHALKCQVIITQPVPIQALRHNPISARYVRIIDHISGESFQGRYSNDVRIMFEFFTPPTGHCPNHATYQYYSRYNLGHPLARRGCRIAPLSIVD